VVEQSVEGLIPGYASLARLSVSLLATSPQARAPGASVLVAGCGSSAELLEARRLRPDWTLTAVDPSGPMLALAQRQLEEAGPQQEEAEPQTTETAPPIQWIQTTVEDLPAEAVFDGAMAVLVLQGLADDGHKLRFLSSLARTLRPGAQVVLVDQMLPERTGMEKQLIAAREIFQGGPSGDQGMEPARHGLGEVHPISIARLAGLLEASGFSDPAPVFRALDFEGFVIQRLP
jgi:tRNA (cmo5U34)-methyltransferase